MGWSHKVWVWFCFLNSYRVHRCSEAGLFFQKVKHQCSSLEQNQTSSKAQSYPKSLVLFWCFAKMIQKSCELETDTAGFCQAFPETMLKQISLLLPPQLLHARETTLRKSTIQPCLKEFMIWIGKAQEEKGWSHAQAKLWQVTIVSSPWVLPATLP